ncbi:hypothetical protein [Rhodoferax antarcticus]|nr:hypothetical protein [Rhodoferax antarcticus]
MTPANAAAAAAAAQADGQALGNTQLSGPATPAVLIPMGATPGANNIMGSQYTGSADPALTGLVTNPSLVVTGGAAKTTSVNGFTGYTNNRLDQSNQAAYFVTQTPILVPSVPISDPLRTIATLPIATAPFVSSTSAPVCGANFTTTPIDTSQAHTCTESYIPYVVSCSSSLVVNVDHHATCNIGQAYSVSMWSTSGMGSDGCQGGDHLIAQWTCTTSDYPVIAMATNSKGNSDRWAVVPTGNSAVVQVYGGCYARYTNTTTCLNGECSGSYLMQIGIMKTPKACDPGDLTISSKQCLHTVGICGSRAGCTQTYYPPRPTGPAAFVETSFGAGSRITASGLFSMAETIVKPTVDSTSCNALKAYAQ